MDTMAAAAPRGDLLSTRRLKVFLLTAALVLSLAPARPLLAWGGVAHGILTTSAVDRLDGPLGVFFKANRDFLVCYSILPDNWWGSPNLMSQLPAGLENPAQPNGPKEIGRHHLAVDDEAYAGGRGARSGALTPCGRVQAMEFFKKYVAEHGQEALDRFRRENRWFQGGLAELPAALFEKAGDLAWIIQERLDDMTQAMKAGRWARALFLATVVGHYATDAHVPLHAAVNYNGQFHPNPMVRGIHSRWEGKMLSRREPELLKVLAGRIRGAPPAQAAPLEPAALQAFVFERINDSFSQVDQLLLDDDEILRGMYPNGPPGQPATRGDRRSGPNPYTPPYFDQLWKRQGENAKERLWQSIETTVSLWKTAWERAGRPQPPAGSIETPAMFLIDFRSEKLVPFDPRRGTRLPD